ncbi:sigma factor regulatory protein, FecR/PupR family [Sphingobacterium spiritivorum ATCC 33300]|uniref:Sigma factor regulatory protein, FecR/PupR family n=1 Tax=Sphingobacterium spiritivorum ATCC 33300 TaxID=525372 RepID=C2G4N2_SPHSI|nr:FecR family protein [Sphingobacterium spiritivorum]EEI89845.1 sigma factor regulatory protein, FecR/PupR family [Sphingobacterium spiritivorum ATCC 33300]QQS94824.1 FecR family protein [Sphingobacterium spiritivorum]
MLTKDQYIQLYEKYTNGNCSKEELQQLEAYKDDFQCVETPWDRDSMGESDEVRKRIYDKLFYKINESPISKQRSYSWLKWGAVAATLMVFMGLVWIIKRNQVVEPPEQSIIGNLIKPGSDKAILILEDGSQLDLEKIKSGAIHNNGKYIAEKIKGGQLAYKDEDVKTVSDVGYHILQTPKGGQFQLRLPDGTIAWLNASSSIKYPTAFVGAERRVEISGEVYFDVKKKNGKHFVVKTDDQEITVLGTRFNVFAYPEEPFVQTSLIEGKVQLNTKDHQLMLKPGLSSVYNKATEKVRTRSFDPDEVLAWQRGYFNFNAEHIESVMRKISRWYDVEIVYQGDMKGKFFSGTLSRSSNVQDLLDVMALTETVKFKIVERRIYVMDCIEPLNP